MEEKSYLGVMIDCSRNAVMRVSAVKGLLDKLALLGYNAFMLYTEDTFEVTDEPMFGYLRGRYSKAELKEIDEYAYQKGIEVIPCVQTLAHYDRLFQWPVYEKIHDMRDVLMADDERTDELLEHIFSTCEECFRSRKIHINMDEAHWLGLGKYLTKHGYCDRFEIFARHLEKVCAMAERHGFKPMMHSDMFFRLIYDGEYYGSGKKVPRRIRDKIPENVDIVYWDYYHIKKETYNDYIRQHKALKRPLWFYGGAWKWIGFHAGNERTFLRLKPALEACAENGIGNFVLSLWGDNGNETPNYAVLPCLVYAAECARGNYDLENAKQKFETLFGERWDDFLLFDMILPHPKAKEQYNNASKNMLYCDCFLGKFDSGVFGDGRERRDFKAYISRFARAKKRSKNFAYLFEMYEQFCKVMSVKYDLGYRTRKAYQARDMQELERLVGDYKKCIVYVEGFLKAFRTAWFHDNKPHGFDVQDIRFGGMLQRLKSCRDRLQAYSEGKLDKIEELEEEMQNYYDEEDWNGLPIVGYNYIDAATVNTL